jgi:hypothetical protein
MTFIKVPYKNSAVAGQKTLKLLNKSQPVKPVSKNYMMPMQCVDEVQSFFLLSDRVVHTVHRCCKQC